MPSLSPHSEENAQLAGLYALGVLDGEELVAFERHLSGCTECRRIVEEDRQSLEQLGPAVTEMDPSPDFKVRLLERAAREMREQYEVQPSPEPRPVPWRRRALGGVLPAAAVLALSFGLGALAGQQWYAQQVMASTTLSSQTGPGAVVVVVRHSGSVELQLSGLPDLPPGHVYQAWVIAQGGNPIPAGATERASGTVRLDRPAFGQTVAITQEPRPGLPTPTTQPLVAGTLSFEAP